MLDAIEQLAPENAEAWRLFHQIATRFGADLHGIAAVTLERLTAHLDREAFGETVERLAIIYDWVYPPRQD